MITQTYTFRDLPKAIVNDENNHGLKWTRGVEKDIQSELGEFLNTRWTPTGEREMTLKVDVPTKDAEFLRCLLHNLHSGKLI